MVALHGPPYLVYRIVSPPLPYIAYVLAVDDYFVFALQAQNIPVIKFPDRRVCHSTLACVKKEVTSNTTLEQVAFITPFLTHAGPASLSEWGSWYVCTSVPTYPAHYVAELPLVMFVLLLCRFFCEY